MLKAQPVHHIRVTLCSCSFSSRHSSPFYSGKKPSFFSELFPLPLSPLLCFSSLFILFLSTPLRLQGFFPLSPFFFPLFSSLFSFSGGFFLNSFSILREGLEQGGSEVASARRNLKEFSIHFSKGGGSYLFSAGELGSLALSFSFWDGVCFPTKSSPTCLQLGTAPSTC